MNTNNMSAEGGSAFGGQKITPFLWFDKNAEEAMNFYVSVFNGAPRKKQESKVVNIKRYPSPPAGGALEEPMKGMEGKVLTGVFELDGQTFMALDGGPLFKPNESVSLLVDCQTQEEIDYFWDKFTSDGGQESECGWLKDKYGFSWQIAPNMEKWLNNPDKEKSARGIQAMLGMKKIIIADLENA
jgi:predicted 3-demethylubiquinone-9 3-methyltransferase (glyoxalase superfamily)